MIATHLNAPYGKIVRAEDVAVAFREGSVHSLRPLGLTHDLVSTMFVECSPPLIGGACYEAGVDLVNANKLYRELLAEQDMPAVYAWEDAMKGVVD